MANEELKQAANKLVDSGIVWGNKYLANLIAHQKFAPTIPKEIVRAVTFGFSLGTLLERGIDMKVIGSVMSELNKEHQP